MHVENLKAEKTRRVTVSEPLVLVLQVVLGPPVLLAPPESRPRLVSRDPTKTRGGDYILLLH